MALEPDTSKKLKPYAAVRKGFSAALLKQWQSQGPVTLEAILRIQQSRKYSRSPISALKRA